LNVITEELLFQVKTLTAALNSFRVVIDLEKEEDVVLLNLRIISIDEGVNVTDYLVGLDRDLRLESL